MKIRPPPDPENDDAPEDQSGDAKQRNQDKTSTRRRKPIPFFAIVASDIWGNSKVMRAGADGALEYIFALTQNAQRGRTGTFPAKDFEPWYLARVLGMDEQRAEHARQRCVDAGLLAIDGDMVRIVGWDDQWSRDELTAQERETKRAERAKRARGKKPDQDPDKRSESEIESETQTKSKPDTVGTLSRQPGHLPHNWVPSSETLDKGIEWGLDAAELRDEVEAFQDHCLANGKVMADFDHGLRLWFKKRVDYLVLKGDRVRAEPEPKRNRYAPSDDEPPYFVFDAQAPDDEPSKDSRADAILESVATVLDASSSAEMDERIERGEITVTDALKVLGVNAVNAKIVEYEDDHILRERVIEVPWDEVRKALGEG